MNLREKRLEKGLTITQLAELSGVAASTISKLELGKQPLTEKMKQRLVTELDCDEDEIEAAPKMRVAVLETKPAPKPAKKAMTVRWYTVEEKAPTVPCLIANQNGFVLCTQRVIAVDDGRRVLYFNGLHGLRDEDIKPDLAISFWMPIPEVPR